MQDWLTELKTFLSQKLAAVGEGWRRDLKILIALVSLTLFCVALVRTTAWEGFAILGVILNLASVLWFIWIYVKRLVWPDVKKAIALVKTRTKRREKLR